ncbi:MAG TPA: hypothetical protein EYH31_01960 [Anaerolineae bacterium]|nr:hypothetical protein [Anaerolineae bacterium]
MALEAEEEKLVGRILRADTASFAIGCRTLATEMPAFGTLVKARGSSDGYIYGLIYNVRIEDDPFVRQIIAAGDVPPEIIEDQRQRRQVPIEVSVLVVGGCRADGQIFYHLPPLPPATLNQVWVCGEDELRRFTERFDFFRIVLGARDAPADELLTAILRRAASVRSDPAQYLVHAGRELATLLGQDMVRLDGILHSLTM